MILLAIRLAIAGGREQLVRLVVTAVGVGLGVVLLLLAAVTFPAFKAHEARAGWTDTSAHNAQPAQDESRTDPLLWRMRDDGFAGRDLLHVDVAPLGPHSPVPPGISRLPGPGELAVSPALRRLMTDVPAAQLANRFPGRIVATVGRAALQAPDSLVIFVGYDPDHLTGQPGVIQVRSIEGAPRNAAPTRFGRVIIGIGGAALLLPILVLIGSATRLAAARREQRLAAMRLVGALPRQIRAIAAIEATLSALCGTALGFAGFAVARPYAARTDMDGSPFFPADLHLAWSSAVLVGLGVPALSALAALVSLRAVQMSPLGVTRQATRKPAAWWRILPLTAGVIGFVVTLPILTTTEGDGALWLLAAVMALLIIGIVIVGPWLTTGVGKVLIWVGRRAPTTLAGHRLTADPSGSFRSISGLVLAVFLVTLISALSAATLARLPDPGRIVLPAGTVGTEFGDQHAVPLSAERTSALIAQLHAIAGVTAVVDLRTSASSLPANRNDPVRVLTRCANLRAAALADCPDPAGTVSVDARGLASGDVRDVRTDATARADSLPMLGLLVTTDASVSAIESVRTAIESATTDDAPTLPWTTTELKGLNNRQVDRITSIANSILLVTLVIAGFSLAVSVTGGLVERKRPFALLRLAGMRSRELSRVLIVETAAPLIGIAGTSVMLGLAVAADVLRVNHMPWVPPGASYWWTLAAGLTTALAVALAATIPLRRITSLETARFE
ncbi:FtsX-like permease family protein [Dactylosporangium sp. NPDC000244]|uniref:FtsX-like permease family protein n=1 Tax=Dactylosporangium sp. NPDC000244 TaxID=3154365 RepID=UPI0033234D7F